jgi:hypothetical protein
LRSTSAGFALAAASAAASGGSSRMGVRRRLGQGMDPRIGHAVCLGQQPGVLHTLLVALEAATGSAGPRAPGMLDVGFTRWGQQQRPAMSVATVAAERRNSSAIAPRAGESERMLPSVIGGPRSYRQKERPRRGLGAGRGLSIADEVARQSVLQIQSAASVNGQQSN